MFFYKFQQEILEIMSRGDNIKEVKALMPQVKSIFEMYSQHLKQMNVPLEELVFTKRISKNSSEYRSRNRNTLESNAIMQLEIEGKSLRAGEILQYIVTDYYYDKKKSSHKRVVPVELINRNTLSPAYDVKRYIELLAETCNSVTEPFGFAITTCQDTTTMRLL